MTHPKYPLMFSPLTIRGNRLKNRIIMGSMHSGLEDLPNAAERLSAYFVERGPIRAVRQRNTLRRRAKDRGGSRRRIGGARGHRANAAGSRARPSGSNP